MESLGRRPPVGAPSADGRAAISGYLSDENVTVRQWSAGFALAWDLVLARAELERPAADDRNLVGFEAKMTLREYDAGRLNLTWELKRRS